jgi:long-chain acyl-CoA synthetase
MAESIFELFKEAVARRGDKVSAQYKVAGAWRDISWNEMDGVVGRAAAGLVKHGVQAKDRVSILSHTRPDWVLADMGILGAGGTTVPIYQSNLADECAYILQDSEAVLVFAEDTEQLEKLRSIREQIPGVKKVVCFSGPVDEASGWELSWPALLADGEAYLQEHRAEVQARGAALSREDLLTIIYTSGTTGRPKGAMLSHDNMLFEAEAVVKEGYIRSDDVEYLFLPMAHVFAKVLEVVWLAEAHVMAFWEGDQAKIVDNLREVRPTIMASVPRIFEKVHAKVVSDIQDAAGIKGFLGRWALGEADKATRAELAGGKATGLGWSLAHWLVWQKVEAKLADRFGGRLRFFISGGAPLATDIAFFFKHAGVTICEGYGLTESAAAACVNRPKDVRIGTVGTPLPGCEVKIAADGEILIRGRNIMKGYWNKPEATAEAIDAEGWLHSGDIGVIDPDGKVRITDRKKDIIVTAGGKNVAPQNIENNLKSKSPLISQVVVHGDRRKFLSALITVEPDSLRQWAKSRGISAFDYKLASQDPALREEIQNVVNEVNKGLASYESLKRFSVLDHDFEIGDQLTPTLKVKRKVCNERYKDIFDGFYVD